MPDEFIILLSKYILIYAISVQYFSYIDKMWVLQQEYSQPPVLPYPHFWWVVNCGSNVLTTLRGPRCCSCMFYYGNLKSSQNLDMCLFKNCVQLGLFIFLVVMDTHVLPVTSTYYHNCFFYQFHHL